MQRQVREACEALKLEPEVYELLKEPLRVIELSIPVKMDDGSVKVLKAIVQCIMMQWGQERENKISQG